MSTPVDLTEGLDGAKLAVTVLMIRDSPTGLEVYVQERVSSMPTFPNATVFPGGGVDPRDFEVDGVESEHETFGGPSLMHWARSLGTNRNRARALLFAAARELFEETGTLLATHSDGTPIPDATQYHPQRLALESHRLSLSQVLARHDLTLRSEWLRPSTRWVSPETDEKRFDMFAFVAVQPPGQEPDGNTREAASTGWFSPSLILDGWRAGLIRLVIPTWAQLLILSRFDCVRDVLEFLRRADMTPIIGDPVDDPRFEEFYSFTPPERF